MPRKRVDPQRKHKRADGITQIVGPYDFPLGSALGRIPPEARSDYDPDAPYPHPRVRLFHAVLAHMETEAARRVHEMAVADGRATKRVLKRGSVVYTYRLPLIKPKRKPKRRAPKDERPWGKPPLIDPDDPYNK